MKITMFTGARSHKHLLLVQGKVNDKVLLICLSEKKPSLYVNLVAIVSKIVFTDQCG